MGWLKETPREGVWDYEDSTSIKGHTVRGMGWFGKPGAEQGNTNWLLLILKSDPGPHVVQISMFLWSGRESSE